MPSQVQFVTTNNRLGSLVVASAHLSCHTPQDASNILVGECYIHRTIGPNCATDDVALDLFVVNKPWCQNIRQL